MRCKSVRDSAMRGQQFAVSIAALVLSAAFIARAADLPDGAGKAETIRVCGKCHPLDQAVSLRQGQPGWRETISKMVDLGAEGSDAEFAAILNYLVKNFGAGNPKSPSTGPTPPDTPPPRTRSPNDSAPEVALGVDLLNAGLTEIAVGQSQVSAGQTELATGYERIRVGATRLNAGQT